MKKILLAILLFAFAVPALADTVTVSWSNVAGNDGYVIQRKADTCASAASFATAGTVLIDVVTFTDPNNWIAGQDLCFRVAAFKPGGVVQTYSAGVDFTVPSPLPAPGGIVVTSP